jgi:hypothetical protein
MSWILLIAIAAVVVVLMIVTKLKQHDAGSDSLPYTKNDVLFSPAERSFLGVLEQAIGENYSVFGKVRVADIVSVRSMRNRSAWQRAFNRISAKHFDYVLCTKDDLSIVCVIELDDQSHRQRKRQERDAFLVKLCQSISLPLIQIPAQRSYAVPDLRFKVLEGLGQKQQPIVAQPPVKSLHIRAQEVDPGLATNSPEVSASGPQQPLQAVVEPADPVCPKCSAPMVHREVKTGSKAGQKFWGCSKFPKCRGVTLSL